MGGMEGRKGWKQGREEREETRKEGGWKERREMMEGGRREIGRLERRRGIGEGITKRYPDRREKRGKGEGNPMVRRKSG